MNQWIAQSASPNSNWRQYAAMAGTLEARRYVAAAILAASERGFQPRVGRAGAFRGLSRLSGFGGIQWIKNEPRNWWQDAAITGTLESRRYPGAHPTPLTGRGSRGSRPIKVDQRISKRIKVIFIKLLSYVRVCPGIRLPSRRDGFTRASRTTAVQFHILPLRCCKKGVWRLNCGAFWFIRYVHSNAIT
jgi:hypothetical protein